jgi:uncharacterized membrane protein YedE/YeeE
MAILITFLAGLIFAFGLGISGMTQPEKITGFLNFLGDWDPSMLFVMGGAVTTYFIGHIFLLKRPAPYLKPKFILPTRRDVDRQLLIGSSLFGLGWGLIGFCPGPALVSAITGHESVLIFVLAMGVGMYAFEVLNVRFSMEPDGGAGLLTKT